TPEAPKITGDGALLGTPSYMSPEQARGSSDVDVRSDVFTMGILLYEMVSGKNPFASGSYHSVVAAILEREPEPLMTIPLPLWDVIVKALKKRPEERYQSAQELAQALRETAGARRVVTEVTPATPIPVSDSSSAVISGIHDARSRKLQRTVLDAHGVERRARRATKAVGILIGCAVMLAITGA